MASNVKDVCRVLEKALEADAYQSKITLYNPFDLYIYIYYRTES